MRKLLNKPWFAGLLALAALLLVAQSVMPGLFSRSAPVPQGATPAVDETTSPQETAATPASTPSERSDFLANLKLNEVARDPFPSFVSKSSLPTAVEKAALPDILESVRLGALWTQNGRTFALLNDRVLVAGETIGRLTLESADERGVWVRHWKGHDFIELGKEFTLSTPAEKADASAPLVTKS